MTNLWDYSNAKKMFECTKMYCQKHFDLAGSSSLDVLSNGDAFFISGIFPGGNQEFDLVFGGYKDVLMIIFNCKIGKRFVHNQEGVLDFGYDWDRVSSLVNYFNTKFSSYYVAKIETGSNYDMGVDRMERFVDKLNLTYIVQGVPSVENAIGQIEQRISALFTNKEMFNTVKEILYTAEKSRK